MSKSNIILFGPPGIGKSTLIGVLKLHGQKAIDLEDVYPNKLRFQIPDIVEGTFIGGADLNPQRNYNNCKKVLLYMDQTAYEARRSERDRVFTEKAGQSQHQVNDWMKGGGFNYILDIENVPPDMIAETLIDLM